MSNYPYRSDEYRFPWLRIEYLDDHPLYFMMSGPRSESWYESGMDGHKDLMGLISPADRVLDCGANEGYTTILSALKTFKMGKVLAIEAARHNIEPIKINRQLNGMHWVDVLHAAVGEVSGSVPFGGEIVGQGEEVRCVTIDELDFRPNVIKLDIEGYELRALNGAVRTLRDYEPVIFLEAHLSGEGGVDMSRFGDSPKMILDFLAEHHYRAYLANGTEVTQPEAMPNGVMICRHK